MKSITIILLALLLVLNNKLYAEPESKSSALIRYINNQDQSLSFKQISQSNLDAIDLYEYSLTTQIWRDIQWSHKLLILWPKSLKYSNTILIYIGGSKDGQKKLSLAKNIVEKSSIPVAVLSSVPNQPLFDGKKENALLAYTLHKYLESGDESWPILFPMVKSVVRAMDAIEQITLTKFGKSTTNYVASGASKRGWTAWLSGGVDKRVIGIAPIVFDMLNMKAQTAWAAKNYGAQSEKIKDFTELGLVDRIEEPRSRLMRQWIDPYEIRDLLTMPKLIMLGTNDPYWVVDAQQHYIDELPGSTLIFQEPNGDHHISSSQQLVSTLAKWLKLVANGEELPNIEWSLVAYKGKPESLTIKSNMEIGEWRLWSANSLTRDFRGAKWSIVDRKLGSSSNKNHNFTLKRPPNGYSAYYAELVITADDGNYTLGSQAYVLP